MKNKYWFKPKRYGYGVYPVSWEGWLATLMLLGVLIFLAYLNGFFDNPEKTENTTFFLFEAITCAFVFIALFKDKTEGELKWHWGEKKKK